MKRYRLFAAAFAALGAFACSGSPASEPVDDSPGSAVDETEESHVAGDTLEPFYSFEVEGHTFELSEPTPGSLMISEKAGVDDALFLDRLQGITSASDLYSYFHEGPVPAEITEYEQRASEVGNLLETEQVPAEAVELASADSQETPTRSSARPGLSLLHENGSASHFQSENCPSLPENLAFFQSIEGRNPIANRLYCWSSGFTGNWTEGPFDSKVLTTRLAAINGNVQYTMSNGVSSFQFEALQGQQIGHTWRNETFTHDCCPGFPWACGTCDTSIRVRPMKVTVHGVNDDWRFGGGFWR